jgi:hypothetical protein
MSASLEAVVARARALPIYCPRDVARHSSQDDAWVSLAGRVFDVTPLLRPGGVRIAADAETLIAAMGTDVSHWFDAAGENVKTFVDPVTNLVSPYLPGGRFPHIPPTAVPTTGWAPPNSPPWWQNPSFVVGRLSPQPRQVRVVNTLTSHEHLLDVGAEQTVAEIAAKYLEFNAHSRGYVWKVLMPGGAITPLDMERTLVENGVEDDVEEREQLGLHGDEFLTHLLLYFADGLTVA